MDEPRGRERQRQAALHRPVVVNQLTPADALIVGAPAYCGSMASPVKRLFEDCAVAGNPPVADRSRPWHSDLFRDKVGAAFTASATPHGGNEPVLHSILTMMHLDTLVVMPGQSEPILEHEGPPYGATAVRGPNGDREPSAAEQQAARALGRRVAEVSAWVAIGRAAWWKVAAPQAPRRMKTH